MSPGGRVGFQLIMQRCIRRGFHPVSSLEASAQRQLAAARSHWSIENSLHWSLGVTFREDQSRVPRTTAPQNMATLRQISHNLLKRETSLKVGIQGKRLQAGWREDYLLKVLLG